MNLRMITILTAVAMLFGVANSTHAQLASNKETLRGHQNVFVSVTTPDSDVAIHELKLKKESLESFVVRRLQRNKIELDNTNILGAVEGKSILVTGAAGSIRRMAARATACRSMHRCSLRWRAIRPSIAARRVPIP